MKENLVILFVNYNCGQDIADNIEKINAMNFNSYHVEYIVVDNCSKDNSISFIRNLKLDNIKIIISNENIGFGRACNLGLTNISCKYILLLNPDIQLFDNSINNLIDFADKNEEAGIYGGLTINDTGICDNMNAWREPSLLGLTYWAFFLTRLFPNSAIFNPDKYVDFNWEYKTKVDAVSGCFFLIKNILWKKLKGFDPRYFMYSEEIDLCKRARKIGATPLITNSSQITHFGSRTLTNEKKLFFLYRSKLIYFKSNFNYIEYLLSIILLLLAFSFRAIASLVKINITDAKIWGNLIVKLLPFV
ncbi:MAG: glycosyltransferase family 2 protein [Methylococcales bacterium]|nr:glycosyltransferase family 2 protein [Methylococcales bacterium]